MGNNLDIVPLTRQPREVLRFLKVSYGIYRNDPHWVAPLLMDLKKVFTDANPGPSHLENAQADPAAAQDRDTGAGGWWN